ncbi:MAG TPA: hypothetical protein VGT41_00895 [Candidatus Babeliales bacterium]|nr:hypothetical protein [Candidatus Babeliales bacterium]
MRTPHFLLLAVLLCLTSRNSFSAAELERKEAAEIDPLTRSLLMFLDDSEAYRQNEEDKSHLGPLANTALHAIDDQVCPILISGSLLYNLLREPKEYDKRKKEFDLFYRNFDPQKWIIRKVRTTEDQVTTRYCMIPIGYQGISENNLQELKTDAPLTELEYNLGLKIEHMDVIPIIPVDEQAPLNDKQNLRNYFRAQYDTYNSKNYRNALKNKSGHDFIKNCVEEKSIFVEHADYNKIKREPIRWIFYLNGHGGYGATIAQLSFKEFDTLLTFLEKNIVTIFFAYCTCFAAGFNATQLFGEITSKTGMRSLPFPIVVQGLVDLSVNKVLGESFKFDFFIQTLISNPSNYREAMSYVMPSLSVSDIPQIKLPHVPAWFPITKVDNAVARITKIEIATRKSPLVVGDKPLLLYTNHVPFPINFSSSKPIISMIPGNAVHIIDTATFSNAQALDDFFDNMDDVGKYGPSKLFFIKTIRFAQPATGHNDHSDVTNVIIDYKPIEKPLRFFTQSGQQQTYTSHWTVEPYEDGDYMAMYEAELLKNYIPEPAIASARTIEQALEKKLYQHQADDLFLDMVRTGDIKKVQDLMNTGIAINSTSQQNALIIAAQNGDKRMVELLLIAGMHSTIAAHVARKADYRDIAVLIENADNIKLRQLIKLQLYPKLNSSTRENLRDILEEASKKKPDALRLIKDIITQLLSHNARKAVVLIKKAYQDAMSFDEDFSIQEFEQDKWQKILTGLMNDKEIATLLDQYTPTISPIEKSEEERKEQSK